MHYLLYALNDNIPNNHIQEKVFCPKAAQTSKAQAIIYIRPFV